MIKINGAVMFLIVLLAGVADFSWGGSMHALGRQSGLPDTGLTLCYDSASGIIGCPAHGASSEQDASYNPLSTQPNFTDNGNYTITDNRTGLMWKKCSEGQANDNTCTGTAATYLWAAALSQCSGLTTPGGYTDWRLPNVRELLSIVRYNTSSPAINLTYFPNTGSDFYWTSTNNALPAELSKAWYVSFYLGESNVHVKATETYRVRCVRGGP